MAVISMKQFLEAGVHFGHQTKRWHPKMSPYIYGIKNGVHVIDLRQTLTKLKEAYEYVKHSAEEGRVPLFVGTKTQVQAIVKEEANRCGCPYINFRWLGGLLTNFGTIKQSVARMKSFEEFAGEDGSYEGFIKKEALIMERKRLKLERSLGGVRNMNSIPSILFITDCHKEQLALKEAQKLDIPVVGVSDTNCDPTGIDYVIPGNDDSPRAVALYANVISTAVLEGLANRKQNLLNLESDKILPTKEKKIISKDNENKSDSKQKKGRKTPSTNTKITPSKLDIKVDNKNDNISEVSNLKKDDKQKQEKKLELKEISSEEKTPDSKNLTTNSISDTKVTTSEKEKISLDKKTSGKEKSLQKNEKSNLSKESAVSPQAIKKGKDSKSIDSKKKIKS